MKSIEDIKKLIEEVSCEPFQFRIECLTCVREVTVQERIQRDMEDAAIDEDHTAMRDLSFELLQITESVHQHAWFLQAKMWRKDTNTDDFGWGYGGKYLLSEHMTDTEIIHKALSACLAYAEHEVREAFMWRGRRILGPHVSIENLWDVAESMEYRN